MTREDRPVDLDSSPIRIRKYWLEFDADRDHASRFYEAFRVGFTDRHADNGALLILEGVKTTTSSLLWEYEESGRALPYPGALSVLLDGLHMPACIVETTKVEVLPFDGVDEAFCKAYAESDGTIAGWRKLNWPIYEAQCQNLGRAAAMDMPLVCETFSIVFPTKPVVVATSMDTLRTRMQSGELD